MTKITGTVKWFSNRKGFGFIAPTSDNSPTEEEIFVHQTSIFSGGDYRTLAKDTVVEFEIEKEESGKLKAVNVTAPGGGPIKPPPREPKNKRRSKAKNGHGAASSSGDENGEPTKVEKGGRNGTKPTSTRDPPFHDVIGKEAKDKIAAQGVDLGRKTTIDVAAGDARVKLGQGGYAAVALTSGVIGEGTYTCDEKGVVTFTWERCMTYVDGQWKSEGIDKLMKTLSLTDGIGPVGSDETAASLWGADKGEPPFAENGFKMKKVVLTKPPGGGRGRRGGGDKKS